MDRIRQRHLAALASCLLVAVAALGAALPAAASATIELGVFNSGAPANAQTVADYTQMVGRAPDIVMWYHDFGDTLLTGEERSTLEATGQTPMVTWEPYGPSLAGIAAGDYDSYLRESARIAKGWGGELMIRFAHEMNGDWYPWARSPSYVAAWRHVVTVFREEGAANVRWVWAPNVDRTGSMPFAPYFPGDAWVDYVGLDGYNFGATPGNRWSSLGEVFSASYAKITQLSAKPLIITETASSEVGGDKADWIRAGFLRTIPQDFPRVTGVIWFNKVQEDNWPIASSQAALDAYREVAACSLYGGPRPCGAVGEGAGAEAVAVESVHVPPRVTAPPARPSGAASYRLTGKAEVRIRVQRHRHGGRFARAATLVRRGHRGRNRVALRRLLAGHRLRPGRYRLVVVASDGMGHRSHPRRAHFRVL